jgi:hypothetical protein
MDNTSAPEYETVEAFAQFLYDDERDTFTANDLVTLNRRLHIPTHTIRKDLEGYGLKLRMRAPEQKVRGIHTSSQDRWYGPGSSPSHGGSGWEQIAGFAGQRG